MLSKKDLRNLISANNKLSQIKYPKGTTKNKSIKLNSSTRLIDPIKSSHHVIERAAEGTDIIKSIT